MSSSNLQSNPFANLFDNANEIQNFVTIANKTDDSSSSALTSVSTSSLRHQLNDILEKIFRLTLNKNYDSNRINCVYIGDGDGQEQLLDKLNIDDLLLQRIMLTDESDLNDRIRPKQAAMISKDTITQKQFDYLFECFRRLNLSKKKLDEIDPTLFESFSNLIFNMCRTILSLFDEYSFDNQSRKSPQSTFDHNYSFDKSSSISSNDLCMQLINLIIKCLNDDGDQLTIELIERFYDSFMKMFEDTDKIKQFYLSSAATNADITENEIDAAELKFLRYIFVYLNNYFINILDCEDYGNSYLKSIELITFITRSKLMKYLFVMDSLSVSQSKASNKGRQYQVQTLIGKILTPHTLPIYKLNSHEQNPFNLNNPTALEYKYFKNPTQLTKRDVELNESNMWQTQQMIKKSLTQFFYDHLIRRNSNAKIRQVWLKFVGDCVSENYKKSQEWNAQAQMASMFNNNNSLFKFASDGFFLNLLDVFLDYCMPFCDKPYSSKLLKINYSYSCKSSLKQNFHVADRETAMIPSNSDQANTTNSITEYNFITESYYGANNLIKLAYLSVYQRIMKLNQELSRWQGTYQQLMESGAGNNDPQMAHLKKMFENMTIEFLNLKSVLLEEDLLKKLSKFLCTSCSWLSYIAINANEQDYVSSSLNDSKNSSEFVLRQIDDVELLRKPTEQFNLRILEQLPEFFVTNIVDFFIFISRFKDTTVNDLLMANLNEMGENKTDTSYLDAFISMVLVFMGNSKYLFNPHCRASLAEAIECIVPKKSNNQTSFDYSTLNKKLLAYYSFVKHPCSSYMCESLLNVFVSIEMTGQSVQFEQKFNYRRPMYELIEFLWKIPEFYSNSEISSISNISYDKNLLNQHRRKLEELANEAYINIENSEQPLFLKFLNFLINDANYLLLEGLLYLEKIKQSQDKLVQDDQDKINNKENRAINDTQRAEIEANLKHMIMLAKFHNLMSLKTIDTIKMLTIQIKKIFCHDILVDRVATMLNDFLLHLVGKKKRKQLKVKNFEEVEFKPKEVVSIICDIYLNLGTEERFCQAVCQDGRSYSSDLFSSAIDILNQIHTDFETVHMFHKLAEKIEEISRIQQIEESNYDDAPDEYLDPITSSLMDDPVILPNSKKIVNRSTIARHLLSDQTDPFNRSPLNLQDVIPATDLKKEIQEWKEKKKAN